MHVDRFRLISALGRGGSSEVFLAIPNDAKPKPVVVVKRIRADVAGDPQWAQMMRDEAHVTSRLSHPNIIQLLEVGSHQRGRSGPHDRGSDDVLGADSTLEHFLVMEHVEGQTLSRFERHRLLKKEHQDKAELSLGAKLLMIVDVLSALHYVHELADPITGDPLHTVHRDVTPHNVLVTYDGHVKLFDFGIAKAKDTIVETKPATLKGKLRYMSPEQARGEVVDRRTDVFAAGVMLWELLTGRRFWSNAWSAVEIHTRLAAGDYESSLQRAIGDDDLLMDRLDDICQRALAFDLRLRYQSARDMRLDLMSVLMKYRPVDARCELGRLVSAIFAEEREKITSLVEQQLALLTKKRLLPPPLPTPTPSPSPFAYAAAASHNNDVFGARSPNRAAADVATNFGLWNTHSDLDETSRRAFAEMDDVAREALEQIDHPTHAFHAFPPIPRAAFVCEDRLSPVPVSSSFEETASSDDVDIDDIDEADEADQAAPTSIQAAPTSTPRSTTTATPTPRPTPTPPTATPTPRRSPTPADEKKKKIIHAKASAFSRLLMLTTFLVITAGSTALTYTQAPASFVARSKQVVVDKTRQLSGVVNPGP